MRRGLASLFTLGVLFSGLLAVVLGLMLYVGVVSLPLAVAAVIVVNVAMLFVSPWINDLIYGWLYDVEWVDPEAFRERSPESMRIVDEVTSEYGYTAPRLGIIPDRNPTAFTYGALRNDARIVVTEGCFEYLDDDELASVVAHELGHVTSRDFVIMTLANTIVQLLYLIGVYSLRIANTANKSVGATKKGDPRSALAVVGIVAYVLWFVSEYAVLYLSRTREYAADAFAAEYADPDDLSMALIKIALGIVESEADPELTKATRNIGIMGVSESKDKGLIFHNVQNREDEDPLLRALLFDLVSPWAHLLELKSTHPLTGKRIRTLSAVSGASRFDFTAIRERFPVDRGRLYGEFARDLLVLSLPLLLAVGFPLAYVGASIYGAIAFSWFTLVGGWLVAVGLAMLIGARYRYPGGEPEQTTVLELLSDVYASPVDGARVQLEGELIGRGTAGYRFSEDLMFQDETGLMYLKYDSWLPLLGDFLFSIRQVPELVGESVTIDGWYFRSTTTWVGLRRLRTGEKTVKGFTHLGSYAGAVIVLLLGAIVLGVPYLL